jgi:hypothetical protein
VSRAIYHHKVRTGEHVTILAYKDSYNAYELLDDREAEHEYPAGDEKYVFEEWVKRNRQLIEDAFRGTA